ncbi:MAG TPA: hypothetical protein VFN67_36785 [Polyangiales bacterium]|nr:hypothetical protein [Polyangiales bacterium]
MVARTLAPTPPLTAAASLVRQLAADSFGAAGIEDAPTTVKGQATERVTFG